jgi:hypothetical protein
MITECDYYVLEECATDCWIKTVWKYGWDYAIDLQDRLPQLELRREQDLFLMEAFAQHNYEASDLRVLNQCRTFLQAVTLADVTMADGKFITQEAWNGNQLNGNRINPYEFPRQQPKLPAKHWELWRSALQELFLKTYGDTNQAHALLQPLGAWNKDPLLTCNWAFNPTTTKAYKRTTKGWEIYNPRGRSRVGARTGGTFQATSTFIPTLPHNTRVATLYTHQKQPSLATLQSFSHHLVRRPPTTSSPTNLEEAIKGLSPDTKWAVETLALGLYQIKLVDCQLVREKS